jgi:hypothetical protein
VSELQFDAIPLWEYVYRDDLLPGMYEWDVMPCLNTAVLPRGVEMMLVTVDIIWNDGSKSIGCCHLAENPPHLFQLSAFYRGNGYALGTRDECDTFAQASGRDLFPARIVSRVSFKGNAGFPEGMLDCDGQIA